MSTPCDACSAAARCHVPLCPGITLPCCPAPWPIDAGFAPIRTPRSYITEVAGLGTMFDTRRTTEYDPTKSVDRFLNLPEVSPVRVWLCHCTWGPGCGNGLWGRHTWTLSRATGLASKRFTACEASFGAWAPGAQHDCLTQQVLQCPLTDSHVALHEKLALAQSAVSLQAVP